MWYVLGVMKQKIVVGGFASDTKQIEHVALVMSEHYDEDVIGLNFRKAMQTSRAFFDDCDVITHSAGMLAVMGSIPERLTAIAPPVPESIYKLMWRGFVLGRKFSLHSENQLKEQEGNAVEELLRHARANFSALPTISHFDAFQDARWYQTHNVPTTVALMENDGLFRLQTPVVQAAMAHARRMNVRIVTTPGEHVRFTHDPVGVLSSIALSESMAAA